MSYDNEPRSPFRGTTICAVKRGGQIAVAGDVVSVDEQDNVTVTSCPLSKPASSSAFNPVIFPRL